MKPIKESPPRTRRKFDLTFKLEAVRNWKASGRSAAVVAKELGLAESRLFAWRKLLPPADAGGRAAAGGRRPAAADLQSRLEAALRENRHLREQRDILKKRWHPLRSTVERYGRGHARRNDHAIARLCENLQVSPSGFHDWDRRRPAPGFRAREDQVLAEQITAIHAESRQTYGSPRIADELRARGRRQGRNRIARLMKSRGICGRQKGRHRVQTTDSDHDTRSLPTASQKPHRPLPPTRSGSPTSPASPPTRVGFISPVSSTSTAAKSSVGP